MQITLKLLATYRKLLPSNAEGNKIVLEISEETSVSNLMVKFNVPQDESSVILLNGAAVPLSTIPKDGDTVTAFSAIAGG